MGADKRIEILNRIESEGLDRFMIEDVNWWPLIRVYICQPPPFSAETQTGVRIRKESLIYPKRVLWDLKLLLKEFDNYFKGRNSFKRKIKKCDSLFIAIANNYKRNSENKLFNRYIDPVYLSETGSKELIHYGELYHEEQYLIPKIHSIEQEKCEYRLRKQARVFWRTLFLMKAEKPFTEKHSEKIQDLILYLRSYEIFSKVNFGHLANRIEEVLFCKGVAMRLLKKTKAKKVVYYCYYSPLQMGFNLAASDLGVCSIDYQHGSQNKWHFAYGSWLNVPVTGYKLLPQEFWLYSIKEEKNIEASFNKKLHKAKVTGNIFLKQWQSQNDPYNEPTLNWLLEYKEKGFKIILFTFSGSLLEKEHFFWSYVHAKKDENIFWLFRLHPGYLSLKPGIESMLDELKVKNYDIDRSTSIELYHLLNLTDLHITQSSFVAEEAVCFSLKSIILDDKWVLYFQDYIDNGEMFHPVNEEELSLMIESNFKNQEIIHH